MTTPLAQGFPDWIPKSVTGDLPALLDLQLNQPVPFVSAVHDVSLFQSYVMSVQYEAPNAGPPQNTAHVIVEHFDNAGAGNLLGRRVFEINSILTTDCGRTTIVDRHHGPYMRISGSAGKGAASTMTLVAYGSTRQVEKCKVWEQGPTAGVGLSTDGALLWADLGLLAGATANLACRIGSGPAYLHVQTQGGGGPIDFFLQSPFLSTVSLGRGRVLKVTALPDGAEPTYRITLPRRVMYLNVINNSATNTENVRVALIVDDN